MGISRSSARFPSSGGRVLCVHGCVSVHSLSFVKKDPASVSYRRDQCPAVESIPGKVSGAWVFKDTRTPVALTFENLQDGMAVDDLIEQFPITREQIRAVLEFAARSLEVPVPAR